MSKVRDWSKLFQEYKGKWLALQDDDVTVIAAGNTLQEVSDAAHKKGFKKPHFTRMPQELVPLPFFPVTQGEK